MVDNRTQSAAETGACPALSDRQTRPARSERRTAGTAPVPLLAEIDAKRQALACTVLSRSPVGEAVRYLTNQWVALQRFVDNGRIVTENNRAEQQLRLVAVGHKN